MKMFIQTKLQWGPFLGILAVLLLGCSVSPEVIIHHSDGKTSTRKSFIVTDSAIILPAVVIDVKTPDASYEQHINATVLLFSQVKDVIVTLPDVTSSERTLGGVVGFAAGAALGAWAGSDAGFGPKKGGIGPSPALETALVGGGVGACLGACLGPYIVDELNLTTVRLNPAIPSQRDSLKLYAEHGE